MSEECVAVDIKRAGIFLTDRATERVNRRSNLNVNKTAVFKHLLPARTGQPSGNSTGPQINVLHRLEWNGKTVSDVSELQCATEPENTVDLGEHSLLVGT